jgi:hypothetical protein
VPSNSVEVARLLLDRGADPTAKARMYGDMHDPLAMLAGSHPFVAGVGADQETLLVSAVQCRRS